MNVTRTLITRSRIAARVAELGPRIAQDLTGPCGEGHSDGGRVVLMPVLTGAMIFVADLIRHMPIKMNICPVTVSSYPGRTTSSQGASIHGAIPNDLAGAQVLIVDDILDSGRTLGLLRQVVAAQNPASLRIAVLLRKRKVAGRDVEVEADYAGFDIDDEFVVGYGLDYDGYFRNLPDIGVLAV